MEKNKKRYGTVNGDSLKRYAPEEKIRYGQGDKFGRTTVLIRIFRVGANSWCNFPFRIKNQIVNGPETVFFSANH